MPVTVVLTNTFTALVHLFGRLHRPSRLTAIVGRTARIGNEGLATSLYNEKDEPLAEDLVKLLLECEQNVPDFLVDKKPQDDEPLIFNDDSAGEDEGEVSADTGGGKGAWGTENNAASSTPIQGSHDDWQTANNQPQVW